MDSPINDDENADFLDEGNLMNLQESEPASTALANGGNAVPVTSSDEDGPRSSVITARGTSEGLVLRVDGRIHGADLKPAVRDFLVSRKSFLAGHDVAFEWVGKKPDEALVTELTQMLSSDFSISVRSSRLTSTRTTAQGTNSSGPVKQQSSGKGSSARGIDGGTPATNEIPSVGSQVGMNIQGSGSSATIPHNLSVVSGARANTGRTSTADQKAAPKVTLFDGIDVEGKAGSNALFWDEPDARVVYGTLRSGQKIETEHSLVVFGDVNSGAEVIAGGDIVILGTLRGVAHAGAYDESGGGRVILSLNLQPTQLRIGLVISRGSGADRVDPQKNQIPEIARVEGNTIVVEPYQSRTVWIRRRE